MIRNFRWVDTLFCINLYALRSKVHDWFFRHLVSAPWAVKFVEIRVYWGCVWTEALLLHRWLAMHALLQACTWWLALHGAGGLHCMQFCKLDSGAPKWFKEAMWAECIGLVTWTHNIGWCLKLWGVQSILPVVSWHWTLPCIEVAARTSMWALALYSCNFGHN